MLAMMMAAMQGNPVVVTPDGTSKTWMPGEGEGTYGASGTLTISGGTGSYVSVEVEPVSGFIPSSSDASTSAWVVGADTAPSSSVIRIKATDSVGRVGYSPNITISI